VQQTPPTPVQSGASADIGADPPNPRDRPEGPAKPWIVAIVFGLALMVTSGLHALPSRPLAAWVVPLLWLWGGLVVLGARRAPSLPVVLLAAAVLRALFVGTPPWLSDDLYRYLWEGLAWRHGYAPLYDPPSSIEGLAPDLRAQVTHGHLPSVYPPLAMSWFALLSTLGGTVAVAQGATALMDLLTVTALHRWRPSMAWLYALHPVAVLESAAGAHIDIVAIALAAAAVAIVPAGPARVLGLWAGGLTKLFPFVAVPTALRALPLPQAVPTVVAALAATALLAAPHVRLDIPPGLVAYGTHWSFNGFAWTWVHPVLGTATRPVLVGLGALVGVVTLLRRTDPVVVWRDVAAAFVLLSPTLHPWYVLWVVVPDLLLGQRRWAAASVALAGSYLVLGTFDPADGTWAEAPWLWWVTWGPALVALGAYPFRDDSPTAP